MFKTLRHRLWPLLALSTLLATLQGCSPATLGGATAMGVAVVHDKRTTATVLEDQVIELKVMERVLGPLRKEGGEGSHIAVTSYNNVVLLTGEVPSNEIKARAEQLTREVEKVRRVYNELAVMPSASIQERSQDTFTTLKVKYALTRLPEDAATDFTQVKVVTERGVVYLMGLIGRADADTVVDITRRVDGVQRVVKIFEYLD